VQSSKDIYLEIGSDQLHRELDYRHCRFAFPCRRRFLGVFMELLPAVFFIASLHRLTGKCKLLAVQQIAAQQAARAQAGAAAQWS
jgi:hypothetical protein